MIAHAVRCENLSRSFGNLKAVDSLTLEVPHGIVFGFLGPNGSGKTTTIRMLLGLLEPTSGAATVLGFDIHHQSADIRERTGALMEHNGLYERLSAYDNLDFYARIWHMPKAERQARIHELLEHLDLWERRQDMVATWSKGMRQKLAVARALLHHPPLVILDEPTSGLDPVAAAALRQDIAGLVEKEGTTVFLNTHNLSEAEKLCTQVGIIHNGKLLVVDSPANLRAHQDMGQATRNVVVTGHGFDQSLLVKLQAHPEIVAASVHNGNLSLTISGELNVGEIVLCLTQNGAQVEDIQREQNSLESVFLSLVNAG